jgi:predicted transcriptional regulator
MIPNPAPSLFDPADDAEEARAMAEAEAALAAGRVVSHEAVTRWLQSWGTADELPPPVCGQ